MSAASSDADDDDFQFGTSEIRSKRYPIHDCCEFEDAESLRRLIFVPQDSDSGSESGSEQSSEGDGDDSSSSSTDDNDSTEAAHAAAIGHSPAPIPPSDVKAAPVGATAAVAAGMGANMAPAGELGNSNGDVSAGKPSETETSKEEGGNKGGEMDKTKAGTEVSPSVDGEGHAEETVPQPSGPMNVDSDSPQDNDVHMASPEQQQAAKPRISVSVPPGEAHKQSKKKKKRRKKDQEPRYYCPHDLNERDDDENTALHIAIHARKLEHVRLLIVAGASVHKKSDGSFPIHTAVSIGSIAAHADFAYECTVFLGESSADLSVKDDSMHTPLYLACAMNLPRIAGYILSDPEGMSTLNVRADRSGGRALHAAAKFDTQTTSAFARPSAGSGEHSRPAGGHHHPDGTLAHSGHHIPGLDDTGKRAPSQPASAPAESQTTAAVTELLLSTPGVEIDALNSIGQTPLHVACARGNWPVVRLLLGAGASPTIADRRGNTPGQLAHKRGMLVPVDIAPMLGGSLATSQPRDLVVDPDSTTLLLCHELCLHHRSCPPIRRDSHEPPPPENVRRLHVLLNKDDGILQTGEFGRCVWQGEARRASMADVLKVHDYSYVESICSLCAAIPDHPNAITHLDPDTAVSKWSFEAALRAAGSVCEAVDKVVAGDFRNAFCAVRPPGHHSGPRGIVKCSNDPEGSHGFCLLNNVAIGAAYARSMYRNEGIRKIAIIDFDVHHGNGTEEVVRQLVPSIEKYPVQTPFAVGELSTPRYRPWLDETDINNVFFASTHGYGPKAIELGGVANPVQGAWFYPGSGKTHTSLAVENPSLVETPGLTDFIMSQSWTRMGEDSKANCCRIINCGLELPQHDAIPGMQRLELRDTYRKKILPHLREFDPDIIFISAGFDAHKRDSMNFGYVGMVEDDYEWVTEQLVKIANTCCNGRIVSVLEGGYKIHGGIVSPFARSVASHVRALVDGGRSRELYEAEDCSWESQFERHVVEERERKRQQKIERLQRVAEESRRQLYASRLGEDKREGSSVEESLMKAPLNEHPVPPDDSEGPSRKRRRNQVDYRELYEQMKKEGFAG